MAVTPAPTSANQTNYLNGLVKAGGGNAEWAKAQLGAVPQVNQTPSSGVGISSAPQAATPKPILGGLTQAQLTAMGEGIKSLGTNFGTGSSQTPSPQANSLTPNAAPTVPTPLTGGVPKPDFDAKAIAASRFAAQRAALAGSVSAYDAQRKATYDYMTKNTQDQRNLDAANFNENSNPFSGKYQYDKTNILRNNNIQDTQNQTNYQNDIAASDAKLAAFDANSEGFQQDIENQLNQQNFTNTLAQNQDSRATQGQDFNQNLQSNQFNQQAQNQQFNQTMATNEFAYKQARDAIGDEQYKAKFDNDVKQQGFENAVKIAVTNHQMSQDAAQLAISSRNADISQQNADTSSSNSSWARDPKNPDNMYKLAELDKLKNGSSADMSKELDGLYTGLTSGQLSASAAIAEIDGRVKAGLTTATEAEQMKKLISTVTSSQPNVRPNLTQAQIDANGGNNPQDLNSAQLDNLWKTDPSGKAAGRPSIDWGEWYTDPRGHVGGISYEAWKQAYGPQLKAR